MIGGVWGYGQIWSRSQGRETAIEEGGEVGRKAAALDVGAKTPPAGRGGCAGGEMCVGAWRA